MECKSSSVTVSASSYESFERLYPYCGVQVAILSDAVSMIHMYMLLIKQSLDVLLAFSFTFSSKKET